MRLTLKWFKLGILIGGFWTSTTLIALPTVESRTGEPIVRSSVSHSSSMSGADDRAAHLTLTQIEALKQEISELRGLVEVQDHEIKQLKKSQQDFYVDLDRRLNQAQQPSKVRTASAPQSGNKSLSNLKAKPSVSVPKTPEVKESLVVEQEELAPTEMPEVLTKTLPPTPASSSKPAVTTHVKSEREVFEAAYNLVKGKRYPEAIIALQGYLNQHPTGVDVANAHYWLGEVYRVQWQSDKSNGGLLDKATQQFSSITTSHPTHTKAVDALLKLGLIESDKGNVEGARRYLTEVHDKYPGTAAARIADTRLQQLTGSY